MSIETAITFKCGVDELIGIIHQPAGGSVYSAGVLIVVGGPQYRVGSHRQFVTLARDLAKAGIPVMRFDFRGMGDSGGEQISFEDTEPDIKAAIDAFKEHCKTVDRIVLWGLCDAASAALMYSHGDERVHGLVLANPWVRTEAGIAKVHLKHYYISRFFDKAFWVKVLCFKFDFKASMLSFLKQLNTIAFKSRSADSKKGATLPFQKRMERAVSSFTGKILFIISGNDLTAMEFKNLVNSSNTWKKKIKEKNAEWYDLEASDHTFSKKQWKKNVSELTINWIQDV